MDFLCSIKNAVEIIGSHSKYVGFDDFSENLHYEIYDQPAGINLRLF